MAENVKLKLQDQPLTGTLTTQYISIDVLSGVQGNTFFYYYSYSIFYQDMAAVGNWQGRNNTLAWGAEVPAPWTRFQTTGTFAYINTIIVSLQ